MRVLSNEHGLEKILVLACYLLKAAAFQLEITTYVLADLPDHHAPKNTPPWLLLMGKQLQNKMKVLKTMPRQH